MRGLAEIQDPWMVTYKHIHVIWFLGNLHIAPPVGMTGNLKTVRIYGLIALKIDAIFYMRQRYKNLMAAITIPPTVRVVANDQIIK